MVELTYKEDNYKSGSGKVLLQTLYIKNKGKVICELSGRTIGGLQQMKKSDPKNYESTIKRYLGEVVRGLPKEEADAVMKEVTEKLNSYKDLM
ncbi:MAG: hypothetical protein ABII22_02090 [Candidatus Micrarchaeota archaeon]